MFKAVVLYRREKRNSFPEIRTAVVKRSVIPVTCQQNALISRSGAPAVATLCGLPSLP